MKESVSDEPLVLKGNYVDMYAPDFPLLREKTVAPGEHALLCDLDKITEQTAIIGTSVRVKELTVDKDRIRLTVRGASGFTAYLRLKTPFAVRRATIGNDPCFFDFDSETETVLLRFESAAGDREMLLLNE